MMRRKKMWTIIITTILLIICFFAGLYVLGTKSEPYRFALQYIDKNETIEANLGKVKSHRLALGGYSIRYSGPSGHAEFKIIVRGEKDSGEVYLDLGKSTGQWSVSEANLKFNNKIVNLH